MSHTDPAAEETPDPFVEQLIRFQDGVLSPEETAHFSAAMAGNLERQRQFIDAQFRSAMLREIFQRQAYEVADVEQLPEADRLERPRHCASRSIHSPAGTTGRWKRQAGWFFSTLIITAVVLLMFSGLLSPRTSTAPLVQPHHPPTTHPIAQQVVVAGVSQASFFGKGFLTAGQPMHIGDDCMLMTGMVKLAFPSGATAIVEGPAMFRVMAVDVLALDTGVCSVHAPDGAEGFRVVTPLTQVIDRGTRFSVTVRDSTETEVQVIEGAADLVSEKRSQTSAADSPSTPTASNSGLRLTERQAVRLSGFGERSQQPASFDPLSYRRQLPDRVVDYQASTTAAGCVQQLQQITVQRGGELHTYSSQELIPIEVISFRGAQEADSNGHLLGGETPPAKRHTWLEDMRLDTGVINFGGGESPLTTDPVLQGPETTPGLGVQFRTPIANRPGPDVVLFEIQCFTNPLAGDPFHVSPVHFRPGLTSKTITHFDLTMGSPEAREAPPFWLYRFTEPVGSLADLSTMSIEPNGGVMRLHFRVLAVGIDLTDLGFADGEQVQELFFQHATVGTGSKVDPVLIAGLPSIISPDEVNKK